MRLLLICLAAWVAGSVTAVAIYIAVCQLMRSRRSPGPRHPGWDREYPIADLEAAAYRDAEQRQAVNN